MVCHDHKVITDNDWYLGDGRVCQEILQRQQQGGCLTTATFRFNLIWANYLGELSHFCKSCFKLHDGIKKKNRRKSAAYESVTPAVVKGGVVITTHISIGKYSSLFYMVSNHKGHFPFSVNPDN